MYNRLHIHTQAVVDSCLIGDCLHPATEEAGQEMTSLYFRRALTLFLHGLGDETFPMPDEVQEASQRHSLSTLRLHSVVQVFK